MKGTLVDQRINLDTVVGTSLGGCLARVDPLDLRLSVYVAGQAQTIVSAIGGQRLSAPYSVAAASARGCGKRKGGCAINLLVTQMTELLTQLATGPARVLSNSYCRESWADPDRTGLLRVSWFDPPLVVQPEV